MFWTTVSAPTKPDHTAGPSGTAFAGTDITAAPAANTVANATLGTNFSNNCMIAYSCNKGALINTGANEHN
jgi:hypothetical protein